MIQGPAAVLFGRGGGGGVVNLVTRQASRGASSDAAVELGAYGHHRATTRLTTPVGVASAVGLNAMVEDSDGFRDGYFLQRHAANPTFATGIGASSTLTIGMEHLRDHRLADHGIPSSAGRPADVDPGQLFGSRQQNDARSGVDSVYATIEHRFSPHLTVRNNVLVGRYNKFYQNVYPGSAVTPGGTLTLSAYNHRIDRTNAFNQTDFVYDGTLGGMRHTILAGVEAGHQLQDELRNTASPIPGVSLSQSERDADFASAPVTADRNATSSVLAMYVQDQVALSRRWKAVAGARIDRFSVDVDDHMPSGSALGRTDRAVSPRAGLIYQPAGGVSIYGSYSYTFLPSGQTLGLAQNTVELRPEDARNYEAGTRSIFAAGG